MPNKTSDTSNLLPRLLFFSIPISSYTIINMTVTQFSNFLFFHKCLLATYLSIKLKMG